ncbi:hypothetical protein [Pseudonocardia phyllosphaerae]|uniref:hypothetical protein n=1 Tax=Pseudonocardia phyllosphaerae TaxID=3390502 RepID=UPI00397DBFFC
MPPAVPATRTCACGHPEEMHDHFRAGTDCGACGAAVCGKFQLLGERPGALRRFVDRLRG